MARAEAAAPSAPPAARRAPWPVRLGERLPGSPWAQGAGIAAAGLALRPLVFWLEPPPRGVGFGALALPLLGGYLVAIIHVAVRAWAQMVGRLAPALRDRTRAPALAALGREAPRASLVLAAVFGLGVPSLISVPAGRWSATLAGAPWAVWIFALAIGVWWCFGVAIAMLLARTADVYRIARDELRVDLFDLRPLAPFGRYALRVSLAAVGALALLGILAMLPDIGEAAIVNLEVGGVRFAALGLGVTAVFATAALVLPLLGVRARIRRDKEEAITRIGRALDAHGALLDALGDDARLERAARLLALRDRVAGVREWPLDAPMLRRFGLYLLIPVGSWIAGALVERGVDAALR